jgi:protein-L-isoaspartate(D-aspartate) O-methyltransferase
MMKDLVEQLVEHGTLRTPRIIDAFKAIDRAYFVPDKVQAQAYEDHPIHIGYQQTISQPTTVAFMLELLAPQEGERILDIGSGSGWTTALLAHIVGQDGQVLGLERVHELVEYGRKNLEHYRMPWATIETARTEMGAQEKAPFDRILVSASARSFPHEILSQVREGGVLVVPVREAIWRVERVEHQPIIDKYEGFVFVPLINE